MGIRASSEASAAKDSGSCVGGLLSGRKPRAKETVKGGRDERVKGAGRVVRKGKVSGALVEFHRFRLVLCKFLGSYVEDGYLRWKERSGDRCRLYTLVAGTLSGLPLHCHGRLAANRAGDGSGGWI